MINYGLLTSVFLISLLASFLLTPLAKSIALKLNIMSQPGARKIHVSAVPYLGGLAIYCAFVIALSIILYFDHSLKAESCKQFAGILVGSLFIVALGLWDDIKDIKPRFKLIGQIIVALILFSFGLRIEVLSNPFSGGLIHLPLAVSLVFTLLWFLGLMNAMNLIDGLDGLACGITVIVSGALIFIALYLNNYANVFLLAALAGSCLGFLRFNFYPAKIFMGDSGSMFLGMILASVALIGSQHKAATAVILLTPLTALTIPVYDIFAALLRRISKKQPVFNPDRKHIHHRLLDLGLSQRQITLFFYLATFYLSVFAFLFVLIPEQYALVLLILLALGLSISLLVVTFIESKLRLVCK
ncbi:MAG: undecaprenyl/decaprenyl-phosphate alpha-N-acetylglucosaminyl 1-phosphate transferase [Omnitrophica bacterium]|nr:undecaprenyl/decaprenyl-phosphate alpha-N-acetylglucosaminyl 1-phosphate transferase [Candidatus Omnitrophota bacterium]